MPNAARKLKRAGDIELESVEIFTSKQAEPIDITFQVVGIEIYEELLLGCFTSGKIILNDAQDLTTFLPFIGQEKVKIKAFTPGAPPEEALNHTYQIYKIDNKSRTAKRAQSYVIHFISEEAITDLNTKISRAYQGDVSSIVEEILTKEDGLNSKKTIDFEPTINKTKFISNFWNPMKCVQYACKTAVNGNDSPSYVFYETRRSLNFGSLDTLYDQPQVQDFIWDNYTAKILHGEGGGSVKNPTEDYRRIYDYNQPISFDYIDNLESGMYGSTISYYDILSHQIVNNEYTATWDGKSKHLNKFPLWTDKLIAQPKARLIYGKQYYNNFDGYDASTANTKIIQQWTSLMAQAEGYKCRINVPGKLSYSVGQKVMLTIPKNKEHTRKDPEENIDKLQSGYYLISSLVHLINGTDHTCNMELIKDSYMIDIKDIKDIGAKNA